MNKLVQKLTLIVCLLAGCLYASNATMLPCPVGTPPATISETFSSTVDVKLEEGASERSGTGEWHRSMANQAYQVKYNLEDGTTLEFFGLFAADKRMRYSIETTSSGNSNCASTPILGGEKFEYFDFLADAQCIEVNVGGEATDARASFEEGKTRVVEVKRDSPSKLYRYTEDYGTNEEQLTFKTFDPVEPDPSVFNVPAICGQGKLLRF